VKVTQNKKSKNKHKNPSTQLSKQKNSDPHSIGNSMLFEVKNWDREKLAKWFVDENHLKFVAFVKLLDGIDLLGGDIVHLSFDCPRNLREYFNKVARRKYGSSCRALRSFMLKIIAQHVLEKHALGNTLSDVVPSVFNVPQIVMPTYVQSRPRRYVKDSRFVSCQARGCKEHAEFRFYHYNGNVYLLCRRHVEEYRRLCLESGFNVNVEPLVFDQKIN